LTADHGDEFLEHGRTGHNKQLFQESIAVPLIVKFPSRRWSGSRFGVPISIVDIAPTLLDYLGQPPHPEFDGQSLLPLIQEDATQEERTLFADLRDDTKAVRYGRYKFITRWNHPESGVGQLFDLVEDPSEKLNLARMDPQLAETMRARIADWR
jgi:arylsulfatase A-like enzyme